MAKVGEHAPVDDETAGFFAVSATAIAVVGSDGRLRRVNSAWTARLGTPRPDESLVELVAPADRASLSTAMAGLREGVAAELHLRFTRADNVDVWMACELTAEKGAARFYCAVRPSTAPRVDEGHSRVVAGLMRTLDETEAFGLYMVAEESGRPLYANATAGRLWEMPDLPERVRAGTVSGADVRRHVETIVSGPIPPPTDVHAELASAGSPRDFELSLRDGRSLLWLVTPVNDESGRRVARLYVSKDITERRAAEKTLAGALERQKRSEAEFRRLLEHVPDGIVVMRDGKFAYANPAAARILGYDRADELIGVHFAAIVRPDELTQSVERVRLMTGGAPPPRTLRPMVRRDGTTVYAETLGFQTELDGAPATLVIAHDVTEERRIEAQMRQAERLASLGTLSAAIAHEINNPLTYILLNLQATRRWLGQLSETAPSSLLLRALELIDQSLEGAERVRLIVKDLRSFSRADDSENTLVDVRTVLESVIPMAEHEFRRRADLVRDYQEVPLVRANAARLGQVFLNLLVNAAHAIPERQATAQEIRVAIFAEGDDKVVVTVRDTGEGMTADVRERVFDPFFTTKAPGVGTGLGLSLCLGIVHTLGGDISLESEVGRGSTFRVTLPAAGPEPERRTKNSIPLTIPRARILVVDDEPRIATRLAELLKHHEVVIATSGNDALGHLRNGSFDVVFCDLMMPDVKGTDVFEAVSRDRPDMRARFIFMTAGAFTPSARALLDRVSNPRLDKPFTEAQVQQVLALVLATAANN